MGLLNTIRSAVATADRVTQPLQAPVTLEVFIGQNPYGEKIYAPARVMPAIVDWKQKQVRTLGGTLSVSRAVITFLDIDELVAATNGGGIDDNDKVTLPDGTTGPILDMAGFIDAGTGIPVATEVYLG